MVIGLGGGILFQKQSEAQTLHKQDGNPWRGRGMGNNEVMVSRFRAHGREHVPVYKVNLLILQWIKTSEERWMWYITVY